MERDTKRGRLEELLSADQVRRLFILGGKELILELDVMEMVFVYQALPPIRNRLKAEHVWNLIYNEKLVPQMLKLGIEPKRLGDDERQNCLAWAFALKMYSLEVSDETPSQWYVEGKMRAANSSGSDTIIFESFRGSFDIGFYTRSVFMRGDIIRELFDDNKYNPSFYVNKLNADEFHTRWNVVGTSPAVQQLGQVIYVFLSKGYSMVVHWHNGDYIARPKQFQVRERLE